MSMGSFLDWLWLGGIDVRVVLRRFFCGLEGEGVVLRMFFSIAA